MSYYYEINKQFLQGLEAVYGLPDSLLTRSWSTVNTSLDGLWVIIESSEPLDETILQVEVMNVTQTKELISSPKYYIDELWKYLIH